MLRRPQFKSDDPQDEAYRVLRSNLAVALADIDRPSIAVTSSQPGEGKTATTVNLARSMALAGRRVVLVDLDLRHPDSHRWLGAHNERGVSDVLLDRLPLDDALQYVSLSPDSDQNQTGFYLLATGPQVGNPAELLGTRRTFDMLQRLGREADLVLIDTPPALLVADTLVVSRMAGGVLLVVEPRRTPLAAVQRAKDAITRNQGRILGLVINKYQAKDAPDATYGYGYGYGYGSKHDAAADANGNPT
ncbi:MAG: tyrosine-protein kinase [Actinomycetota bacterium]